MRYGLISDIHGNLEALEAVLNVLGKERTDAYLCIGDIVGYGADPKECIKIVRALKPRMLIAGNHEWGLLGLLCLDFFNEYAAEAITWTRSALGVGELEYLRSFKLSSSDGEMTLVHGTLDEPAEFRYILDTSDADRTLRLLKTTLCFIGHSHVPGIFAFDGRISGRVRGSRVKMEPGKKYVVNIGSIGQPRDGDPRASFAVYDEEDKTVEIKRVSYNIEEAQAKILAAGLPEPLALRLAKGQ